MMRHTLFFFFAIFFFNLIIAQSNEFIIHGTIHGIDTGTIEMWVPRTFDNTFNVPISKVKIINSQFTFKGYLNHPNETLLVLTSEKEYESKWFFFDTGYQKLDIHIMNDELSIRSSSISFNEFNKINDTLLKLHKEERKIEYQIDSLSDIENESIFKVKESIAALLSSLKLSEDTLFWKHVKTHPKSWVSLLELQYFINRNPYSPLYDSAFAIMDKHFEMNLEKKTIIEMLDNSRKIQIGLSFPDMSIYDFNGNNVSLNKTQLGKYTLLDFWFSSCGPCNAQIPKLKQLYSKWHDHGFEITSIATDYKKYESELTSVIKKHELKWAQYWDHDYRESNKYSIIYFPTNFLLDRNGKILSRNIELYQLKKFLETNLR